MPLHGSSNARKLSVDPFYHHPRPRRTSAKRKASSGEGSGCQGLERLRRGVSRSRGAKLFQSLGECVWFGVLSHARALRVATNKKLD